MATEEELAPVRSRLLGLIPEERIRLVQLTRPSPETVRALSMLDDLSSTISDALDELRIGGAASAQDLSARVPAGRVCGPAITIRYARESGGVSSASRGDRAKLADRDLYGVGEPGDVAIFDCGGCTTASVMGGLSARWARRSAIAGCIVDGAVRDLKTIREVGLPVWSRGVTPVSGKHRLEAIEINGVVAIAGIRVRPGDLVAADETGVAVVPLDAVDEVLRICVAAEQGEQALIEAIERGASVEEVGEIVRPERW